MRTAKQAYIIAKKMVRKSNINMMLKHRMRYKNRLRIITCYEIDDSFLFVTTIMGGAPIQIYKDENIESGYYKVNLFSEQLNGQMGKYRKIPLEILK